MQNPGIVSSGLPVVVTGDVTVVKTPLTPSSPTAGSVGVASASLVASNASRKGLIIQNLSNNTVSLGLGAAAVLNSGVTLYPGGTYQMSEYDYVTSTVNAIASAAASTVSIQEFV